MFLLLVYLLILLLALCIQPGNPLHAKSCIVILGNQDSMEWPVGTVLEVYMASNSPAEGALSVTLPIGNVSIKQLRLSVLTNY
jgi:hypothetical protein